jgi:phosphoribosylanthranilate isomerase
MRLSQLPFIKICCIESLQEAELAITAGASTLGLVSAMPSGPGVIEDELIAQIAATVPPPVATFLLTSRQDADAIIEQHHHCRTTAIQLVDRVGHAELRKLRKQLPGIKLVQVIHVADDDSLEEARSVAGLVDALLLDSGNQKLTVKQLGGTGRTHDWQLSRLIRDTAGIPLFLAGGLNADNVSEAMATVRPFGLDLCSSVRSDGRLDAAKLEAFFAAVAR